MLASDSPERQFALSNHVRNISAGTAPTANIQRVPDIASQKQIDRVTDAWDQYGMNEKDCLTKALIERQRDIEESMAVLYYESLCFSVIHFLKTYNCVNWSLPHHTEKRALNH